MMKDAPPHSSEAPTNFPPRALRVGSVLVPIPFALAPMAGHTDFIFRTLCRRHGCGLAYTELVNAQALVHGSPATHFLLYSGHGDRPLGAHLYGSDPGILADAARIIQETRRFDLVDLNCGCPVRRIMARGAGAALLDHPEKIFTFLRAMRQAVSLPVTVKIRLGRTPRRLTVFDVCCAAEEAGAAAIAIHGRFASARHSGPVRWDIIARVKTDRSVPIIGNGGVSTARDALRLWTDTGVDGLMIGRAALGNPWIFQEIAAYLAGRPWVPPSATEQRALILEHLDRLCTLKHGDPRSTHTRKRSRSPEHAAVLQFRAHLLQYVAGRKGAGEIRKRLNGLQTPSDVHQALDHVFPRVDTAPRVEPQ